ncbi:MAG: hypothetical protein ACM33T_00410 [Solirubrobacterales bacterium]
MNLDQLRQRLRPRSGGPLPKDALIDKPDVRDFPWKYRECYRRIERNHLHALMTSDRRRHHALALKVANCTPKQPCGEVVICWRCKVKAGLAEADVMTQAFMAVPRRRISAITIILAVIDQEDIAELRQQIKVFLSQWKAVCERWPGCHWRGRFELDSLTGHPDQKVGRYVQETLKGLGYTPQRDDYGSLLLHTHILLAHPGVPRKRVGDSLGVVYPHSRQVKVTPLRKTQTVDEALSRFATYMFKLKPPFFALAGRGSRTCRPRHSDVLMDYIRLQRRFSGSDLLIHGMTSRRS